MSNLYFIKLLKIYINGLLKLSKISYYTCNYDKYPDKPIDIL